MITYLLQDHLFGLSQSGITNQRWSQLTKSGLTHCIYFLDSHTESSQWQNQFERFIAQAPSLVVHNSDLISRCHASESLHSEQASSSIQTDHSYRPQDHLLALSQPGNVVCCFQWWWLILVLVFILCSTYMLDLVRQSSRVEQHELCAFVSSSETPWNASSMICSKEVLVAFFSCYVSVFRVVHITSMISVSMVLHDRSIYSGSFGSLFFK